MAVSITNVDIKRRLRIPGGTYNCNLVNAGDTVSAVLHGRTAGDVVQFGTTTGGVTAATNYWVINVTNDDTFQVSASRGGAAVTLTSDVANTYSVLSEYDADISALITELSVGLQYTVHSIPLADSSGEDLVQKCIIDIIAGEFLNILRRQQGATESIAVGGLSVGVPVDTGDKLIELGFKTLEPFTKTGYIQGLRDQAVAAFEDAKADRDLTNVNALRDAEKDQQANMALKIAAETAKLTAEELKIDSEELKTDAETAKLTAEELLTDAKTAKIAAETAILTASPDLTTSPQGNMSDTTETFAVDSAEW